MPASDPIDPPTIARGQMHEMLLDFLRENDAACPVCGYSLKGLASPICPECRQDLVLSVGAARLRLGLLLVALAPGFFSGIAACFLCFLTVAIYLEDGYLIPPFVGAVLFGWCSGLFAILLAVRRTRFIGMPRARQRWLVLLIWLAHFGALVLFGLWFDPYFN
jgi:hypothetical protein